VLTEPSCQPGENCGAGDEGAFKGIFVRDLKMLAEIAPANQDKYLSKYNSFFAAQAASIEKNDTTIIHIPPTNITLHLFGMFWNGPHNPIGSDTHESALEALVASL
jgi:predicted alpha-1,6-mannanase (GH76 family)